jgi:hypothetical protein
MTKASIFVDEKMGKGDYGAAGRDQKSEVRSQKSEVRDQRSDDPQLPSNLQRVLAHLDNVGVLLAEMLTMADLTGLMCMVRRRSWES